MFNRRLVFIQEEGHMKKPLILSVGILVILAVIVLWLAFSVGPETAPQDTRSIAIDIDGS